MPEAKTWKSRANATTRLVRLRSGILCVTMQLSLQTDDARLKSTGRGRLIRVCHKLTLFLFKP
ncbi:MAG: hypothetical protein JWO91_346 [Acidobacteriaceae bacterium]|nr:hypothetical protein [Acidobacteriaceae bacterium]